MKKRNKFRRVKRGRPKSPRPSSMSIKSIITSSIYDISSYNVKTLKKIYQKLKKSTSRRVSVYKRHGREAVLPRNIRQVLPPVSKLNKADLIKNIGDMSNFLMSNKKTYTNYLRSRKKAKQRLEESLNRPFENEAEFDELNEFLHEMYLRDKDNWKRHYDDAIELFNQSRRLNIDVDQFYDNYDYWLEMTDELSEIEPLEKGKFTSSTLAKELFKKFGVKLPNDE